MANHDDLSNVLSLARLLQDEPVTVHRVPDGYLDVLRGQRVIGSLDDDIVATFLATAPAALAAARTALIVTPHDP
ncbi:MAG: hypothetical protein GEU98_19935 [Pseudonocardiaceae bacterium]|nr:hypothetical protein [Pseudonocardiaceae bacterium]